MKIGIEQIKNSVPVDELFRRDGHKLIRSSDHFVCLCPFHLERSPSCAVWPDHFFCFGCGAGGDIFNYIEKRDGCGFKEAMAKLTGERYEPVHFTPRPARKAPEPFLDFSRLLCPWVKDTSDEQIDALANQIGVFSDALNCLGVAWAAPHSAWAFPMRDGHGRIVGIRLRTPSGDKFAVKGSHDGLFVPVGLGKVNRLFITEGPTDCAACLSLGFDAIGRANALSKVCIEQCSVFIRKHEVREVVVVCDNDDAGKAGSMKLRKSIRVNSKQLLLPSKDLRGFINIGGGRELIEAILINQKNNPNCASQRTLRSEGTWPPSEATSGGW